MIGIDPGLNGAIAQIRGEEFIIDDMPTHGQGRSRVISPRGLASLMHGLKGDVVIERVASMPRQGVASTFKFGVCYGVAQGCAASGFRVLHFVTPRMWKGALGLSSDKGQSLELARSLWPEYADIYFKLKKHADRAEAALIAHWGRLHLTSAG